ncbi:uncharacterized protein B0T15DRAFT_315030 [Chaetomium strumarium]|uniref:Uncharacterized protein n=1 Tax=Chaetomium strumarium TaxID=1170767 RepID=A0AAJ0GMQ3_9PEZI|nr:hypothetical protein B0T15DRAFT_315030 [Chaetomium strumarium]
MPSPSFTGTNPSTNTTTDLSHQLQGVTLGNNNNNPLSEVNSNFNENENENENDTPTTYTYTERPTQQWDPTIDAICSVIRTAFPSSPHNPVTTTTTTRPDFQSYWHGVFTQLISTVAADATIPQHLTSPPVKDFEIKVFDRGHVGGCPCCLPDVEANILLENEDGVTKVDFVRGVRDYLFAGDTTSSTSSNTVPLVNTEDVEIEMETALVYSAQWMNPFLNHRGVPEVFLYCCSAGRMEEILKEEEEEERDGEKKMEDEMPKGRPRTRRA